MRTFRKWIGAGVVTLVASACTRGQKFIDVRTGNGESAKLAITETLRTNLAAEPSTIDWTISADANAAEVTVNIMEGLVRYDLQDKNLNLLPALATKWEPNANASRWKFTIREGVRWSDGVAFTSQHALDGFKRLLDRSTASPYAYFLFPIKNARRFNEGKVGFDEVGAKLTARNELTVELEQPMSYFPYLLTHHATWPVRYDLIQKYGSLWTNPGKMVSLGPYTLKSWEHDHLLAMERNELYHGEKPQTKYVVNYIINEQATAINLFEAGKLDVIDKVTSIERRKLRGRPEFHEVSALNLYFFSLNTKKPPMENVHVRRALSLAIDRDELARLMTGTYVALSSFVPFGTFATEPDIGLKFNPERARDELRKAGYENPKSLPRFEIAFNTNEDHQRIAENVQEQLRRNLGIQVALRNLEWKVFIATTQTDPPPMFRYGWVGDYPDPDNFLSLMLSYSENNHTRWKNERYDELVLAGSGKLDRKERSEIYRKAQKILTEDEVPAIPVLARVEGTLVSRRVQNYPLNALSVRDYRRVSLE